MQNHNSHISFAVMWMFTGSILKTLMKFSADTTIKLIFNPKNFSHMPLLIFGGVLWEFSAFPCSDGESLW